MKIKSLILILLFLPVFAVAEEKKANPSDELMSFIVEKAKTYTEKGEVAVGKAVDLATQEAPKIVEEFLTWRAYKAGITALLIGIPVFIFVIFIIFSIRKGFKNGWEDAQIALIAVPSIILLTSSPLWGPALFDNILAFVQIQVAPRIYLIEQVSEFLKK